MGAAGKKDKNRIKSEELCDGRLLKVAGAANTEGEAVSTKNTKKEVKRTPLSEINLHQRV